MRIIDRKSQNEKEGSQMCCALMLGAFIVLAIFGG